METMMTHVAEQKEQGFSLVEMTIVLVILGFILSALIMPVTAQREASLSRQTEHQLEIAQKSLIGFAQAHGRLPCPATETSSGFEVPAGGGICDVSARLLPSATLALQSLNSMGQLPDGWGNPIYYKVDQGSRGGSPSPDFTTGTEISQVGISNLKPAIMVCASSASCSATNYLINNAVAVIYSLGSTGARVRAGEAAGGADEMANLDDDYVFVSHDIRTNDPNGSFHHTLTWISPYVLYHAMIEAGRLP